MPHIRLAVIDTYSISGTETRHIPLPRLQPCDRLGFYVEIQIFYGTVYNHGYFLRGFPRVHICPLTVHDTPAAIPRALLLPAKIHAQHIRHHPPPPHVSVFSSFPGGGGETGALRISKNHLRKRLKSASCSQVRRY